MPLLRATLAVVLLWTITACAPAPTETTVDGAPTIDASETAPAVPSATPDAPSASADPSLPQETATPQGTKVASESDATPAEPVTTSTPSETLLPAALIKPGDAGDKVRELQHRLLQLDWFEGQITELFGDQTQLAVEGFQTKRGLPALGFVDEATWNSLLTMSRAPTHDEMYNILTPGPALLASGSEGKGVKDLQARLKQIAWFEASVTGNYGPVTVAAVEGFQEKREIPVTGEVDQRTMDRLTAMTRTPTTDELNNVAPTPKSNAMTLDDRCLTGRVVCISKSQSKLAWVVDGEIRLTMDVRFGSELTPTRNGAFAVNWKSKNHVSSLYDTSMPYALFFSGGQAVHFSADFQARGYNGSSHGCVNVRDKGAVSALFDATTVGDKVIVYQG
ncbi:MAG: peptidoglycan-binding protein [Arachnia sp.]